MKHTKRESRGAARFEKKLAAYTLAGAAALLAPGQANAAIVYVPVDGPVVTQPGTYEFDLPGGEPNDITIAALGFSFGGPSPSGINYVRAETSGDARILLNGPGSGEAAALAFGALIDPGGDSWGTGGKMVSYNTNGPTVNGDWSTSGGTDYLGFYFGAPGSLQTGWAQIATTANASTSSFQVLSYAYETTPNVSITAGAGAPAAVPEPSTMGLLAIGGAGLVALRRRRMANG